MCLYACVYVYAIVYVASKLNEKYQDPLLIVSYSDSLLRYSEREKTIKDLKFLHRYPFLSPFNDLSNRDNYNM